MTVTVPSDSTGDMATETSPALDDAAPPEARLVEKGFTQRGRTAYVGLVFANPSSEDLVDVEVNINVIDGQGNVAGSESANLSVIPSGGTFNVGAELSVGGGDEVEKLEVEAIVGDTVDARYALPEVRNVRLELDREFGLTSVRAEVRNNLTKTLSSITDVFGVLRDSSGQVIAGTFSFPDNDLRPGSRTALELSILDAIPDAQSADVTVDSEVTD